MYTTGKIGPLARKLEATEELLRIAKDEIRALERQLEHSQLSHKVQQTNTGVFWDQARAAERKLARIEAVLAEDEESSEKVRSIRRVLHGQ